MSAKRRNYGRELWDSASIAAQIEDGLPTYKCGSWTVEKLYFLSNYVAQMTQAMVGNPHFSSVNYIDLFASCGACESKDLPRKRYPGSAMLAAMTKKPFSRLVLVESNRSSIQALESRLTKVSNTEKHFIHADCNAAIDSIIALIPDRSLSLAFIDPFSLDIHFETVQRLVENNKKVDLLVLFADDMNIVRNVETYYKPDSKLDSFLGSHSDWRKKWDALQTRDAFHVRQMFSETYLDCSVENLHRGGAFGR